MKKYLAVKLLSAIPNFYLTARIIFKYLAALSIIKHL